MVEADEHDSCASGDADGGDNGRVGVGGSDGRAGEDEAEEGRAGRGGHGEEGGDGEDEEESGNGRADEEEAEMRRMISTTGAARMHPSKEGRSGKYREAMVASWSMTLNCKKTTINLAERPGGARGRG